MTKFKVISIFAMAIIICGMMLLVAIDASAQVPRMTKEELKALLDKADVIIIDVRQPGQWESSNLKVVDARREEPGKKTESWAMKYSKDKTIVLY